jgi:hypothetical protein
VIIIELFKLFGSILVDNEEANKSISATDKKAEGLGKKLGDGIKTAAKWGAGIMAAAGVAGGAMLGLANKTSETADFIDKLSERTGINREELQRWKYAADQSGADISKLEVGIKKLSDTMDDASNGSEKNVKAFEKLGISMDDLKNKSQEQIFEEVMYALSEMPQGAERNALGNDLLGKSYTELLPLLNAGADGMSDLKNRADELGLVMSEDAVKAGVKFGDTWADLKGAFGAVFTHLGTELIPIFQAMADWVLSHMPEIKEFTTNAFGAINTVITKAYDIFNNNILPVLQKLYGWVQSNMPTFKAIFNTVFGAIWDIASQVWHIFTDNLLPILKALYEFIEPTFPIIGEIIKAAFDVIVGIVQTAVDIFDTLTSGIKTAIDWLKKWNSMDAKEKNVSGGHPVNDYDHYASGTNDARGGWSVVGEEGPELLYVPKHSKVIPNDEMNSMGGTQEITVNIPVVLEGKAVTNIVSKIQLDNTRGRARAVGVSI